jgi:fused signal recognition particle receptor
MFNFFRRKKPVETAVEAPVENSIATPVETAIEPTAEVPQNEPFDIAPVFDEVIETPNDSKGVAVINEVTEQPVEVVIAQPAVAAEVVEPEASAAAQANSGWFSRLRQGLAKTGTGIKHVFVSHKVDEELFESLEDALLMADVGVTATTQVMGELRARVKKERSEDAAAVKAVLKKVLVELLTPLEKELNVDADAPLVLMVAGVNGAGKTTSIGKLTHHLQQMGKTIVLAAGDTFRAAAREQLAVWGERNGVTVIAQESGDPAAVVFDAIASAQAKHTDVVIADTAGRLPTQLNLMDELKKIKRVADKAMTGAPHEVILVLDGSMGQNALAQVKSFDEAIGLTGLIVTKLDGSAKGGVLAALAVERHIPVYFIGVGESVHDLQTFDAHEFVDALLD